MGDLWIITSVTAPTEWVSSITYSMQTTQHTMQKFGPQRFKQSNHQRTLHGTNIQRNFTQTSRPTIYSKLDAKHGFWSIHQDIASSYLTTFNKHKGRYRFFCMTFGLKMSQDVFQIRMDQMTNRLPGVIAIHDDICIYGKTQEQHDKLLLQLLKIASKMD